MMPPHDSRMQPSAVSCGSQLSTFVARPRATCARTDLSVLPGLVCTLYTDALRAARWVPTFFSLVAGREPGPHRDGPDRNTAVPGHFSHNPPRSCAFVVERAPVTFATCQPLEPGRQPQSGTLMISFSAFSIARTRSGSCRCFPSDLRRMD